MLREHFLLPDAPFDDVEAYRAATGASALEKARSMRPSAVLAEISASGLRGRGGAGFPVGTKWKTVKNQRSTRRFVVANAAEGEPGTFKDRYLLRQNPYAPLEGMLIAAHVIGAEAIYIGIKASYELETLRLRQAVREMKPLFGELRVEIVTGPEEYLFGEEKALLEVLSGHDPLPRPAEQPPYEVGLFPSPHSANPTLVNNVETFAHVPSILRAGAESFRALGTHDTPGTVLFTVSGAVARPGVYEREAGITIEALLHEVAGGPPEGRSFKAALSGVSSRVIPASRFDTALDFGSMAMIGSSLGSAGIVVLDEETSIPRVAQSVARFLYVESCNQCSSCKHGLRVASHALDELFDASAATPDDVVRALQGARHAPQGNRCYLPVQASQLIPSLIEGFGPEFDAQLQDPARPSEPFPIPKLTDYDEEEGLFSYDERQAHKRPDWTYGERVSTLPTTRRARPSPTPRDRLQNPVVVRLRPEVAEALFARFTDDKRLDRHVNELLLAWLAEHPDG